jgi:hypothetical protein
MANSRKSDEDAGAAHRATLHPGDRSLRDLQPLTGEGKYVFPSPRTRQRPLSNVALLAALRRMGHEQGTLTVSGFT